jgi:predicted nucleic acid-binding protein
MIVRLSTSVKSFVDTNILVYAYDRGAGRKHTLAQSTIEKLWQDNSGVLSTQVLQEFYVNIVVAAQRCGANVILSEDFSHERRFGSVQVLDPFITD